MVWLKTLTVDNDLSAYGQVENGEFVWNTPTSQQELLAKLISEYGPTDTTDGNAQLQWSFILNAISQLVGVLPITGTPNAALTTQSPIQSITLTFGGQTFEVENVDGLVKTLTVDNDLSAYGQVENGEFVWNTPTSQQELLAKLISEYGPTDTTDGNAQLQWSFILNAISQLVGVLPITGTPNAALTTQSPIQSITLTFGGQTFEVENVDGLVKTLTVDNDLSAYGQVENGEFVWNTPTSQQELLAKLISEYGPTDTTDGNAQLQWSFILNAISQLVGVLPITGTPNAALTTQTPIQSITLTFGGQTFEVENVDGLVKTLTVDNDLSAYGQVENGEFVWNTPTSQQELLAKLISEYGPTDTTDGNAQLQWSFILNAISQLVGVLPITGTPNGALTTQTPIQSITLTFGGQTFEVENVDGLVKTLTVDNDLSAYGQVENGEFVWNTPTSQQELLAKLISEYGPTDTTDGNAQLQWSFILNAISQLVGVLPITGTPNAALTTQTPIQSITLTFGGQTFEVENVDGLVKTLTVDNDLSAYGQVENGEFVWNTPTSQQELLAKLIFEYGPTDTTDGNAQLQWSFILNAISQLVGVLPITGTPNAALTTQTPIQSITLTFGGQTFEVENVDGLVKTLTVDNDLSAYGQVENGEFVWNTPTSQQELLAKLISEYGPTDTTDGNAQLQWSFILNAISQLVGVLPITGTPNAALTTQTPIQSITLTFGGQTFEVENVDGLVKTLTVDNDLSAYGQVENGEFVWNTPTSQQELLAKLISEYGPTDTTDGNAQLQWSFILNAISQLVGVLPITGTPNAALTTQTPIQSITLTFGDNDLSAYGQVENGEFVWNTPTSQQELLAKLISEYGPTDTTDGNAQLQWSFILNAISQLVGVLPITGTPNAALTTQTPIQSITLTFGGQTFEVENVDGLVKTLTVDNDLSAYGQVENGEFVWNTPTSQQELLAKLIFEYGPTDTTDGNAQLQWSFILNAISQLVGVLPITGTPNAALTTQTPIQSITLTFGGQTFEVENVDGLVKTLTVDNDLSAYGQVENGEFVWNTPTSQQELLAKLISEYGPTDTTDGNAQLQWSFILNAISQLVGVLPITGTPNAALTTQTPIQSITLTFGGQTFEVENVDGLVKTLTVDNDLSAYGQVENGEFVWNTPTSQQELLAKLISEYGPTDTTDGNAQLQWSFILNAISQLVGVLPITGTPNAALTTQTPIQSITLTFGGQTFEVENVDGLVKTLTVDNDLSAYGQVENGEFVWNTPTSQQELLAKLISEYGPTDTTDGNAQLQWSFILNAISQLVGVLPITGTPNAALTTQTPIQSITLTFGGQTFEVENVDGLVKTLTVDNDLSAYGQVENGEFVWNTPTSQQELLAKLISEYGPTDTTDGNAQLQWSFILNAISQLVGVLPITGTPNAALTTQTPIQSITLTFGGQTFEVENVDGLVKTLTVDNDLSAYGQVENGEFVWNTPTSQQELLAKLISEYGPTDTTDGNAQLQWSFILNAISQLVGVLPITGTPNAALTTQTPIQSITLTFGGQTFEVENVDGLVKTLTVDNDLSAYGQVENGEFVWNTPTSQQELLAKLIFEYGPTDTTDGNAQLQWSFILNAISQLVGVLPITGTPNAALTTQTPIQSITLTFGGQTFEVENVDGLVKTLTVDNDLSAYGQVENGEFVWNTPTSQQELLAKLISEYGPTDTTDGNAQLQWSFILNAISQLVGVLPITGTPNAALTTQTPIQSITLTFGGQTFEVENVDGLVKTLTVDNDLSAYGQVENGEFVWNTPTSQQELLAKLIFEYGPTDTTDGNAQLQWSFILNAISQLVGVLPITGTPNAALTTQTPIQSITLTFGGQTFEVENVDGLVKTLTVDNDLSAYGQVENGEFVWNTPTSQQELLAKLISEYGPTDTTDGNAQLQWSFILNAISQLVGVLPITGTPNAALTTQTPIQSITLTFGGQTFEVENVDGLVKTLTVDNDLSAYGQVENGEFVWNTPTSQQELLAKLISEYGPTDTTDGNAQLQWSFILNAISQLVGVLPITGTPNAALTTQTPIQSITLTFGGQTFEVENVDGLVKTLTVDNDLSAYGQVENGEFVWNTPTSQQELLAKLISEYGPTDTTDGNAQLQWSFILNAISQLVGVLPITGTPNAALTTQTPIQSITLTFGGQTFEVENVDGLVKTLTVDNDLSAYGQVENGEFVWNTPTSQQELLAKLISEYGPTDTTDGNAQLQWSFILNAISQLVGVLPITGTPNAALTTQTPIQSITLTFGGQTFEVENVDGLVKTLTVDNDLSAYGQVENGEFVWNTPTSQQELLAKLISEYGPTDTTDGNAQLQWSFILNAISQLVGVLPITGTPNAALTTQTPIQSITLTFGGQTFEVENVDGLVKTLTVDNDLSAYGQVENGEFVWNTPTSQQELLAKLISEYGPTDTTDGNAQLQWSFILNAISQLVGVLPITGTPNAALTTQTPIQSITLTFGGQTFEVENVDGLVKTLTVDNDLSAYGQVENGEFVWNTPTSQQELLAKLISEYGPTDTTDGNAQLQWSFILNAISQLVGVLPITGTPNAALTTQTPIQSITLTFGGQTFEVENVDGLVKTLTVDNDLSAYGQVENGEFVWNTPTSQQELLAKLISEYGPTDTTDGNAQLQWSFILNAISQLVGVLPITGTPNAALTTQTPIQSITLTFGGQTFEVENVDGLVKTLTVDNDLSAYGQVENGEFVWNTPTSQQELLAKLISEYGPTDTTDGNAQLQWSFILNAISQLVGVLPITGTPNAALTTQTPIQSITLTFGGQTFEVENVDGLVKTLTVDNDLSAYGQVENGEFVWNTPTSQQELLAKLISEYGPTDTTDGNAQLQWSFILNAISQLVGVLPITGTPNAALTTQTPIQSITLTFGGQTFEVENVDGLVKTLTVDNDLSAYGQVENGEFVWNTPTSQQELLAKLIFEYGPTDTTDGNAQLQWSFILNAISQLVGVLPITGTPNAALTTQTPIQSITLTFGGQTFEVENVDGLVKTLTVDNDLSAYGQVENGEFVWNTPTSQQELLAKLISEYGPTDTTDGNAQLQWSFILNAISQLVGVLPITGTPNAALTTQTPIQSITLTFGGQTFEVENVDGLVKTLTVDNDLSAYGQVENGEFVWNTPTSQQELLAKLISEYGPTDTTDGNAQLQWSFILNAISQLSITLTFGGQTFEVENVDGLVKTLTVDNDLSAYGQVENGEFVWNTSTSQQELLAKLISEYGPTDTTDGNAQLQWSFILNAISQLVGVLPITGTPNAALTTQTPIQSITLTFGGQTFEVENVDGLVKTLTVDNDLSAYGQVENGEFVWNTPTSQQELLAKLISEYGPTDTTDGNAQLQWSFILNAISQLVGVLPITGTPNAALTTQTPIQSITLTFGGQTFEVENVDGLVKTLTVDNDLSAYGQVENGEFVWNTPTSQQELLAKLISEYGPTDTTDGNAQLQWSFILNAISQLVGVLPITGTPNAALTTQTPIQSITLTFGDNDLSAYGQVENGEFVWNTPTSQQELLAKLIFEYGPTDTTDGNAQLQWSFILNAISQLVGVLPITGTPNAALTTQTPIQSITLTFGGQTFEVENVDGLVKTLTVDNDLSAYGQVENGEFVWNTPTSQQELLAKLISEYGPTDTTDGNAQLQWSFILNAISQLVGVLPITGTPNAALTTQTPIQSITLTFGGQTFEVENVDGLVKTLTVDNDLQQELLAKLISEYGPTDTTDGNAQLQWSFILNAISQLVGVLPITGTPNAALTTQTPIQSITLTFGDNDLSAYGQVENGEFVWNTPTSQQELLAKLISEYGPTDTTDGNAQLQWSFILNAISQLVGVLPITGTPNAALTTQTPIQSITLTFGGQTFEVENVDGLVKTLTVDNDLSAYGQVENGEFVWNTPTSQQELLAKLISEYGPTDTTDGNAQLQWSFILNAISQLVGVLPITGTPNAALTTQTPIQSITLTFGGQTFEVENVDGLVKTLTVDNDLSAYGQVENGEFVWNTSTSQQELLAKLISEYGPTDTTDGNAQLQWSFILNAISQLVGVLPITGTPNAALTTQTPIQSITLTFGGQTFEVENVDGLVKTLTVDNDLSAYGQVENGEFVWNTPTSQQELLAKLISEYGPTDTTDGNAQLQWSFILNAISQLVGVLPITGTPNAALTTQTPIQSITLTFGGQTFEVENVDGLVKTLTVDNDLSAYGQVENGEFVWNTPTSQQELLAKLISEYGPTDTTDGNAQLQWSFILNAISQLVGVLPITGTPNAALTTQTPIQSITLTFGGQTFEVENVDGLVKTLTVDNDLSAYGQVENGEFVWNTPTSQQELLAKLIFEYGPTDTTDGNAQLQWSFILNAISQLVGVLPITGTPNAALTTQTPIQSITLTFGGQTFEVENVDGLVKTLTVDNDLSAYGQVENGEFVWNTPTSQQELLAKLISEYGPTDTTDGNAQLQWSFILNAISQLVGVLPITGTPNAALTTQTPIQSITLTFGGQTFEVENVDGLVKTLTVDNDLSAYGQVENGEFVWNTPTSQQELLAKLISEYGPTDTTDGNAQLQWSFILNAISQLVGVLPITGTPNAALTTQTPIQSITLTFGGQTFEVENVDGLVKTLTVDNDLSAYGQVENGEFVWNTPTSQQELLAKLISEYGPTDTTDGNAQLQWSFILNAISQLVGVLPITGTPNAALTTQTPIQSITLTFGGQTFEVENVDGLVKTLTVDNDLSAYGQVENGEFVWNTPTSQQELLAKLISEYGPTDTTDGNAQLQWSFILNAISQLVGVLPITGTPNAALTTQTPIQSITLTFGGQTFEVENVDGLVKTLTVDNDLSAYGQVENGEFVWNTPTSQQADKLLAKLISEYGPTDTTDGNAQLQWSFILNAISQLVGVLPITGTPNAALTTQTPIQSITLTFGGQTFEVENVDGLVKTLTVDNDLSAYGQVENGEFVWNTPTSQQELLAKLISEYGPTDTTDGNAQLQWSFILNAISQLVGVLPITGTPNAALTTQTPIQSITLTFGGQTFEVENVDGLVKTLTVDNDLSAYGQVENGEFVWNTPTSQQELLAKLISEYGPTDTTDGNAQLQWSFILNAISQLVGVLPITGTPNAALTTQTPIQSITLTFGGQTFEVENVDGLVKTLTVDNDLSAYGQVENGEFVWNTPTSQQELLAKLISEYGPTDTTDGNAQLQWSFILNAISQLVGVLPITGTPNAALTTQTPIQSITLTFGGQTFEVENVDGLVKTLTVDNDLSAYGQVENGEFVWNTPTSQQELLAKLISEYGPTDTTDGNAQLQWSFILNAISQLVGVLPITGTPNAALTTQTPIQSITLTFGGQTFEVENVDGLVKTLTVDNDLSAYGQVENGDNNLPAYTHVVNERLVWNTPTSQQEFLNVLISKYGLTDAIDGNDGIQWSYILNVVGQMYSQFANVIPTASSTAGVTQTLPAILSSSTTTSSGLPDKVLPTPTVKENLTDTFNVSGSSLNVSSVQNLVQQLKSFNITRYGKVIDGVFTFNSDFNASQLATLLNEKYGPTVEYWSLVIKAFSQLYSRYSAFFVNNNVPIAITSKDGSDIIITNPKDVFVKLNESGIYSQLVGPGGYVINNPNVNLTVLALKLTKSYGESVNYWLTVLQNIGEIVQFIFPSPLTFSVNGRIFFVNDIGLLSKQLNESKVLSQLTQVGGSYQYSSAFNKTQTAKELQVKYGNTLDFWTSLLTILPNLYPSLPPNAGRGGLTIVSNGTTYYIPDPMKLIQQLNSSGLFQYVLIESNSVIITYFNVTEYAEKLNGMYGEGTSFWLAVFNSLPFIFTMTYNKPVVVRYVFSFNGQTYYIDNYKEFLQKIEPTGIFKNLTVVNGHLVWKSGFDANIGASIISSNFGYNSTYSSALISILPFLYELINGPPVTTGTPQITVSLTVNGNKYTINPYTLLSDLQPTGIFNELQKNSVNQWSWVSNFDRTKWIPIISSALKVNETVARDYLVFLPQMFGNYANVTAAKSTTAITLTIL
ncbi:hypothetical protein CHUAL_002051 [Chamberlinius hualienensis]